MGVLLIVLSALAFSLSSYFGKIVTNTTAMSGVITSFGRFFLGAISFFLYIMFKRNSFKAPDIKPIAYRAIFNSIAIILFSTAFQYTTITNANMLHMTYPVFVILLAPFYTKETIRKNIYLYLISIMIGSYVVANPSFNSINMGDILALLSAIIAAFSILSLTESRKENEGYIIIFYVMLMGTIVNIPFAYKDLANFDMSALTLVFISSALGVLGQIFITWGYKYVDSATGSLAATSRIVMSGLIGYLFLNEPLNLRIIIGMTLITLSLVGLSGYFDKKKKDLKGNKF